ncbi:MAG: esterase-like activity of phytase family protein [Tropicimonas sp.]|uniref:esterase-like activity of phytase family protein n=1 Tax=Tropicimonas sp. TaxID=2067044 RepID=UPI003A86CBA9
MKTSTSICILAGLGLAFTPVLAQTPPQTLTVEVLDQRVLPQSEVDGLKFSELSALAHDPRGGVLYGVSDKSTLFRIGFAHDGDEITELVPLDGWRLEDETGVDMKSKQFNPEGAHLREDGSGLLIVSENGPRAALFDMEGRWQSAIDLPVVLRDASRQRSAKDGLEALAEHPEHGLISATEEPQAGIERTHHTIHAADGRHFSYDTGDIGKTNIKSIGLDEHGRLLILERHRVEGTDELKPYLRLIDPAACREGADCPTVRAGFTIPGLEDADFEGMTGLGDDLYLLVSDDKVDGAQRSVFALLRVTAE